MVKLIGAAAVLAAVVVGARALVKWWDRSERETVEVLTGQGGRKSDG